MKSAHTRGQWKLLLNERGFSIEAGGKVICQRAPMPNRDEMAANGRLIASAPDLYAALYQLVMVADTGSDFTNQQVASILKSARMLLLSVDFRPSCDPGDAFDGGRLG